MLTMCDASIHSAGLSFAKVLVAHSDNVDPLGPSISLRLQTCHVEIDHAEDRSREPPGYTDIFPCLQEGGGPIPDPQHVPPEGNRQGKEVNAQVKIDALPHEAIAKQDRPTEDWILQASQGQAKETQ